MFAANSLQVEQNLKLNLSLQAGRTFHHEEREEQQGLQGPHSSVFFVNFVVNYLRGCICSSMYDE